MTKTQIKKMKTIARNGILACLEEKGSASDYAILSYVVSSAKLTKAELADLSPNGKQNVLRSLTSVELSELKKSGHVRETSGEYRLEKQPPIIVQEEACEKEIYALLANSDYSKEVLFERLEQEMGTNKTATKIDDAKLRSIAGTLLKRLTAKGIVLFVGGKYSLQKKENKVYTNTEDGAVDLKDAFLKRLCSMGGPFFERYFMNLLQSYYKLRGMSVQNCQVLGGAFDGGIDGTAETKDWLGFTEIVMVQMKCRGKSPVTEKDVREFYGAMCARGGSRGIYATTSYFHYGAKSFMDKLKNLVGIDGEKLFWMAKLCLYGIKKAKNGYILDESVFL